MSIQGLKDESMDVKLSDGRENGNFDKKLCNAYQTSKVLIDSSYEFKSNMYKRLDSRKFINDEVIDDKYTAEQKCIQFKQLNSVNTLPQDKSTSIKSEESNCTQKCQQNFNKENIYLIQRVKSLESDIEDFKFLCHNDKCKYELLRASKLLIEIELKTSIEVNKMLETQIQNMINEKKLNNKPINQLSGTEEPEEKDVLKYRNEKCTNACCKKNDVFSRNIKNLNSLPSCLNSNEEICIKQINSHRYDEMKRDCKCVRENLNNAEQKLQFKQKTKTYMKKNVSDKFNKLKRTWRCVCKKLGNMFKKSTCTEQMQQETVLKLNEEICNNKKINEKYNNLKDDFLALENKLVCMTEILAFHDQKLRETVSLNEETYMKQEIDDKYNKLKNDWTRVSRKLNDVEYNLQLTSFKLKKETNMKEKIIDSFGELKHEYMCVRKKLENTTQQLLRTEQKLQVTELNLN